MACIGSILTVIDNIDSQLKIESRITSLGEAPDPNIACEFVNAVVLNEQGEALVIERETLGRPAGKWGMLEALITEADDPLTAVKDALRSLTGFETHHWNYIGTYMKNSERNEGIGHIFVAQAAKKCHEPEPYQQNRVSTKWVPFEELRYGLLDGRILSTRYALNVALALLTITQ